MRQIGLIVGALVLIVALVYLNTGIHRNAQADQDDDQSSSQTQAQPAPQKAPPTAPSAPSATLPAEQTVGNPATARYKVTVGWAYDGANQAHPEALNNALEAARQFAQTHKNAAVQIVNTDVPAETRSPGARSVTGPGIAVNGKPLPGLSGNPGEGPETPQAIAGALSAAAH